MYSVLPATQRYIRSADETKAFFSLTPHLLIVCLCNGSLYRTIYHCVCTKGSTFVLPIIICPFSLTKDVVFVWPSGHRCCHVVQYTLLVVLSSRTQCMIELDFDLERVVVVDSTV